MLRGMSDRGYREIPRRLVVVSTTRIRGQTPNSSVHQVVGDGVVHQLRVGLHVHLAQDAGPMGTYSIWTQKQFIRDLTHRLAGSDHPHHLLLAVRERLVERLAAVVLELERELLAQGRGDVAPAAGDL